MIRAAGILFLGLIACAHDRALDRREVGAMKNASPAISPWTGPQADPIAAEQPDGHGRRRPVAFSRRASRSALERSCETGT